MNLNSIAPNARYDLVNGKPSTIQADNDGSFLYRINVQPEMGIPDGKTEEEQIGWSCYEVRVWNKPTKANLKKAVIRSIMDETAEFSIMNDYNKHVLAIKEDSTAVDRYKDYLLFTETLDELLIRDLANN